MKLGFYTTIALAVAVSGCAIKTEQPASKESAYINVPAYSGKYVRKFYDKEDGVVCYVYVGHGISCMPWQPFSTEEEQTQ